MQKRNVSGTEIKQFACKVLCRRRPEKLGQYFIQVLKNKCKFVPNIENSFKVVRVECIRFRIIFKCYYLGASYYLRHDNFRFQKRRVRIFDNNKKRENKTTI